MNWAWCSGVRKDLEEVVRLIATHRHGHAHRAWQSGQRDFPIRSTQIGEEGFSHQVYSKGFPLQVCPRGDRERGGRPTHRPAPSRPSVLRLMIEGFRFDGSGFSGHGHPHRACRSGVPGVRVCGVGFRVDSLWLEVYGVWFIVHGLWFMVEESWLRVQG